LAQKPSVSEQKASGRPHEDAADYHQIARVHANSGRLAEARAWAERALEHNPLLEEAHYTLALIDHEQGELDCALPRLKKVLYLKPDFIMAHVCLADIYSRLGRSTEASRHRNQAIRLASSLPPDTILPGTEDLKAKQLLARA
jgi:tetratricopeptide (TPR) repeat protein